MFEHQRQTVKFQISNAADNAAIFERGAKAISESGWMTLSGVLEGIGVQALITAATMGAAGWLSTTTLATRTAGWVIDLSADGSVARGAVMEVARIGGVSTGKVGAQALAGVMSRAGVGLIVLAGRAITGDFGTKTAGTQSSRWELACSVFLTVLVAWGGSPGVPVNNPALSRLMNILQLPVSRQAAAQYAVALGNAMNTWIKDPGNRAMIDFINANRALFNRKLERAASSAAEAMVSNALNFQNELAAKVMQAASQTDYGKFLPLTARYGDNLRQFTEMCRKLAVFEAKRKFWIDVNHSLNELEASTNQAKQMGR